MDEDLAEGFAGAEPYDLFAENEPGGLFPTVDHRAPPMRGDFWTG